ncbi:MAG TPA: hypothetical protein PKZ76_13760 [Xanthomonadaceae bacterium]|nr:hypothetical protein [Xanthomonadaceae bacterium]
MLYRRIQVLLANLLVLQVVLLDAAISRERVPAEFVHDRVWLTPRLNEQPLRFFTDTGGGFNAISADAVVRLGLPTTTVEDIDVVAWPRFDTGFAPPAPPSHFMDGRLVVVDADKLRGKDGFLGGRWFADSVWEFDYGEGTLHRLTEFVPSDTDGEPVSLGFQTDADGTRTMHFPSIDVTIDGEVLPMLYDSGATMTTTDASAPIFGVEQGTEVAIGFIEASVFERWAAAHPDWRIVDSADRMGGASWRMIEVPMIEIGGHKAGPSWFAERPDGTFGEYMAGMMDRPTLGAIGGSTLRHFRVVLDYPGSAAYFRPIASAPE